jgi:hypothetical protein
MSSSKRLVRFSLTEAAAQLSLTTTTLKKLLKSKGIEPSGPGGFTLRELVSAMTPAEGDSREASLRAHERLQTSKAKLTEHQLAEREGAFIERQAALSFLESFTRGIYDHLYFRAGLSEELRVELESEIEATANALFLRRGWAIEPDFSQPANEEAPTTREQKWASMICALIHAAHEAQSDDDDDDGEQRAGVQSGRGRNRSARASGR